MELKINLFMTTFCTLVLILYDHVGYIFKQ